MTPYFTQAFTVSPVLADCFGRARPSSLLYFIQESAGGHCQQLHLDWDTLAEKGLFWAVIRTSVEITRLPELGETIRVETWPMPTTRSAFPRATVAYDKDGKELFRGISLWVLMDREKRTMVLPGKSGIDLTGTVRGNELPIPASIGLDIDASHSQTRQVMFSQLDRNGHMNNTYYLDWTMDLLPGAFHRSHPIRSFSVCYLAEALEEDRILLSTSFTEDLIFHVDGMGEKGRIFSVQAQF